MGEELGGLSQDCGPQVRQDLQTSCPAAVVGTALAVSVVACFLPEVWGKPEKDSASSEMANAIICH
jgi:hypothetical protein